MSDKYIRDISTLRISDAEEAGGKGANMGELVAARLPVPPGFVLLRDCYRDSMAAGGVDTDLARLHREAIAHVADTANLRERCEQLQGLVEKAAYHRCRPRTTTRRVPRARPERRCRRALLGDR